MKTIKQIFCAHQFWGLISNSYGFLMDYENIYQYMEIRTSQRIFQETHNHLKFVLNFDRQSKDFYNLKNRLIVFVK